MKLALLRVGVDAGSGGIQGPLFQDSSFEYVPIPDYRMVDSRTYGNTKGRHRRLLVEYFPSVHRQKMASQSIHFDPEFQSFTYGDPTSPKSGLKALLPGDLLVFYCGLQGWGFRSPPALYIMGYFEVLIAGVASDFGDRAVKDNFSENFHVRHTSVYSRQKSRLVLVKGGRGSRLLSKALRISSVGRDRSGRELKVLSPEMRRIFGDFGGKISIQRSPPRWVEQAFTAKAADLVRSLD